MILEGRNEYLRIQPQNVMEEKEMNDCMHVCIQKGEISDD